MRALLIALCLALLTGASSHAASIADTLAKTLVRHDAAREVQQRIDALSGRRVSVASTLADQRLADELAKVRAQLEQARAKNSSLRSSVAAKREARAGMRPLLEQMLDLLQASVTADLPFDRTARQTAIDRARHALDDASLRMTDRFDHVLKLYQRELQAGYEIRVGREQREIGAQTRLVNVVKVGRIALYAIDDSATACHVYQRRTQTWQPMSRRQCVDLAAALDDLTVATLRKLPLSVEPH